jgi:hypothetical protein
MAHSCPNHADLPAFGFRCCYADLKVLARRGEDLTDEELAFIGVGVNGHKPAGGWHDPGTLGSYELDLSPEDSTMLHSLMAIDSANLNREWIEFLA